MIINWKVKIELNQLARFDFKMLTLLKIKAFGVSETPKSRLLYIKLLNILALTSLSFFFRRKESELKLEERKRGQNLKAKIFKSNFFKGNLPINFVQSFTVYFIILVWIRNIFPINVYFFLVKVLKCILLGIFIFVTFLPGYFFKKIFPQYLFFNLNPNLWIEWCPLYFNISLS